MTDRGTKETNSLFRQRFLTWDEIELQLKSWAKQYPDFVRLESAGQSGEGRELWVLVIGHAPDRARPAVWVDGNMHAVELSGSSVALSIAEEIIGIHRGENPLSFPPSLMATVKDVLFYVMPRISPDGAEFVLETHGYVRSVPRDARPDAGVPRWKSQDVDGDGRVLLMRQQDRAGDFVESSVVEGLMLPRVLEDEGPFYRVYPEGVIEHFDGHSIPAPGFLSDNEPDLNRNFPWFWAPEPKQMGAGRWPTSEPESRAVVAYVTERPHLFAWLNLHTFGGVYIRPLGHQPDSKMNPTDLALYRQLEEWSKVYTGYPVVSGFHEFLYEPEKPLHGDLSDFAYHQRGCFAVVCELWDFFHQLEFETPKKFVDRYSHITRDEMERVGQWDADQNQGRMVCDWRAVNHPQLGALEVGGFDPLIGCWNPPLERLDELCQAQCNVFFRMAAMAPRVVLSLHGVSYLGDGWAKVEIKVENLGYLPTYVLSSAQALPINAPLIAELIPGEFECSGADQRRTIGQLEGWGRGRFSGGASLFFCRSAGSGHRAVVDWVVRGADAIQVKVGSSRVGWQTLEVDLTNRQE